MLDIIEVILDRKISSSTYYFGGTVKNPMSIFTLLFTPLLFLLPPVQASDKVAKPNAAEVRHAMLVTADWLSEHLGDPSLVLLQVGEKKDYDAAHISGAQYLEYQDISTPHGTGLTLELPPMAQLVSVFEKLGVSNNSHVILYFGKDSVAPTTRVYWTLDNMGLGEHTSVLDGGLPAWREAGKPVTTEVTPAAKGSIIPSPRNDIFADAAWVSSHLNQPDVTIIDARTHEFYTAEKSDGNPRQGHIPGAANLSYLEVVDPKTSKFKSNDALQELFHKAGLKPGNTMVSYCHIGQRATVLYFTAKMLGYNARMYDGSWEDWSHRTGLPVAAGNQPGKP